MDHAGEFNLAVIKALESITDDKVSRLDAQRMRAAAKSLFDHADNAVVKLGGKSLKES